MGAARLRGTAHNSAWFAIPAPDIATLSPTRNEPSNPSPISTTLPAAEYPNGSGSSRRDITALNVAVTPSVFALVNIFLTKSGRALAFAGIDFLAKSTTIRSVPAEIREAVVRTRISRVPALGGGTSFTSSFPFRALWITCFIEALLLRFQRLMQRCLIILDPCASINELQH